MPIDLVIDERDTKPDLGDNNNSSSNGSGGPPGIGLGGGGGSSSNGGIGGLRGNGGGSSDHGHHSDSASTPDHQVCYSVSKLEIFFIIILIHRHCDQTKQNTYNTYYHFNHNFKPPNNRQKRKIRWSISLLTFFCCYFGFLFDLYMTSSVYYLLLYVCHYFSVCVCLCECVNTNALKCRK